LEAGAEADTLVLRDQLESNGVHGAVFCAPATSRNRAMVRLTLNSALTDAEMNHVAEVAKAIAPRVKPWDWPIARRLARGGADAA
jgi:CAI-1 autoinducer synthase